jgi:hypothetical protein
VSTPLVDARRISRTEARAPCPWCRREHIYDTSGRSGLILFLRAQCRVKRALDAYGSPRVIALRVAP